MTPELKKSILDAIDKHDEEDISTEQLIARVVDDTGAEWGEVVDVMEEEATRDPH